MACCEDEDLVVPKGDQGDPGAAGADGENGVNAFTLTTADFLQPAVDTTVVVSVSDGSWVAVGQILFIEDGGYYSVVDSTDTTITLAYSSDYTVFNQGLTSVGGSIASGVKVSPGGVVGPANSTYYSYVVNLTSPGATAPTVYDIENTFGVSAVWTRVSTGVYRCTFASNVLIENYTFILIHNASAFTNQKTCAYWVAENIIAVETVNAANTHVDGILNQTTLEVRIYP